MKYEAFFFDFDGVIADSVEVKTKAFAKLYAMFGKNIENKVIEHHRANGGMTRKEKFVFYHCQYLNKQLTHSELKEMCQAFSNLVVSEVIASKEIKGAGAFLRKWYTHVPCFVISATPDEELFEIVKKRELDQFFKEILGSKRTKDQNLKSLLGKYRYKPEKCLFFGDAESDYNAARKNKIPFIGIAKNNTSPLLKEEFNLKCYQNFIDISDAI